jgi:MFS transporter, YNFM family, putative membrane transport protein
MKTVNASPLIVLYTTIFAFSALYTPQPLLPMMRAEFGVTESTASLLVTATLLPLGFAPIIYGFLLQSYTARRLIAISVFIIMVTELVIFYSHSFLLILLMRFIQGLCIPAILTSLMTYLSSTSSMQSVQRNLSLYVAATIIGGYFGRLLSGLVATCFGWRFSFLAIFFALLLNLVLLHWLKSDPKVGFARLRLSAITDIFKVSGFLRVYLVIFFSFFTFASILNFLPFRLTEIGGNLTELHISTIYTGYLTGCAAALLSTRIIVILGGEPRVIMISLSFYLLSMLFFITSSTSLAFLNMFLFCTAMFLIHAVLPGLINQHAGNKKGVVNGLYISCYYAGGTLGSYLPGIVYKYHGWTMYIYFLSAVVVLAIAIAAGLNRSRFDLAD